MRDGVGAMSEGRQRQAMLNSERCVRSLELQEIALRRWDYDEA